MDEKDLLLEEIDRLIERYFKNEANLTRRTDLPVSRHWTNVLNHIDDKPVTIIIGSTGCGKTTQVCGAGGMHSIEVVLLYFFFHNDNHKIISHVIVFWIHPCNFVGSSTSTRGKTLSKARTMSNCHNSASSNCRKKCRENSLLRKKLDNWNYLWISGKFHVLLLLFPFISSN